MEYQREWRRTPVNGRTFSGLLIVGMLLLSVSAVQAGDHPHMRSVPFDISMSSGSTTFADNGRYPYGGSKRGKYGERGDVLTEDEARVIMKEYFPNRDYTIGSLKDKEFYFEADITDKHGRIVDRVIIDKRSGRIRSVY